MTAPTIVASGNCDFTTATANAASKSTGNMTWLKGDKLTVFGVTENWDVSDANAASTIVNTPTATGVTFLPLGNGGLVADNTNCWLRIWQGIATSDQTAQPVSATRGGGFGGSSSWGISCVIERGDAGLGHFAAAVTTNTRTISLSTQQDSNVMTGIGDWAAIAGGITPTPTATPTPTEIVDWAITAYAGESAYWNGVNAAVNTGYGMQAGGTARDLSLGAIESLSRPDGMVARRARDANVTSQTSFAVDMPEASDIATGNYLIARITSNNSGTNGAAPTMAIADARNGSWTVLGPALQDPGVANDGVAVWIAYVKVASTYTDGDDVTFTFGTATTAKAAHIEEWTNIHATSPVAVSAATNQGASTTPTASITPTASGQLVFVALGSEGPATDTLVNDTDTTDGSWFRLGRWFTNDATATNNVDIRGGCKRVTGTTAQSWGVTVTSRDWATLIVVFDKASATTNQNLSGSITATGALVKSTSKAVAGSSTATGAVARAVTKLLAGSSTATGALRKSVSKALAGSSTPSGALTTLRTIGQSLSGSITGAGAVRKSVGKATSGSTTPAGAPANTTAKGLQASITPAGSLSTLRTIAQSLSGSITAAGAVAKAISKGLAGSVTPSGALSTLRQYSQSLAGSITATGALAKLVGKTVAGSITPTGALTALRTIGQTLTGSITAAGAVTKSVSKAVTGSITTVGSIAKAVSKSLTGSTTPSGDVSFLNTIVQTLSGSITAVGALRKAVSKSTAGSTTATGAPSKAISKGLAGSTTPSGELTVRRVVSQLLEGAITVAGALRKLVGKATSGTVAPEGDPNLLISKGLTGSVTPSGTISNRRTIAMLLEGSITAASTVAKAVSKTTSGTIAAAGALAKAAFKILVGSITGSGSLTMTGGTPTTPGDLCATVDVGRISATVECSGLNARVDGGLISAAVS